MSSTTTLEGSHVLVIDDHPQICRIMRTCLEGAGYGVFTATSGEDGIARFTEERARIDAVFVDLALSDMSGRDVAEALRALRSDALIILMSGFGLEDALEDGEGQDELWFLPKPFLPRQLLDYLEHARRAHALAAGA